MTDLADFTAEQREALLELADRYQVTKPKPVPLHQVLNDAGEILRQLNTVEQNCQPVRERRAKLEAKLAKVSGYANLNWFERQGRGSQLGALGANLATTDAQLSDAAMRVEQLRARLAPLNADIARLDEEWQQVQPQHDKARAALLKRLCDDAETAVKAAVKAGQKASTASGFRSAADDLERAERSLSVARDRLDVLGRVGAKDWR